MRYLIIFLIFISCSTKNELSKGLNVEGFKERTLCQCIVLGQASRKDYSSRKLLPYDPVSVVLYDSIIVENLKPILKEIDLDSIDRANKVTEATTGKQVYNICMKYYKSKNLKKDAKRQVKKAKKIKNLSIKEDKNQKKKIQGFNCYKVIATYTEIEEAVNDPEFPEFNKPEEYIDVKLEMWITKDIKTLYHPVLKVKEILENFYPLEINESNNFIEGSIRKYTLKEIIKM